MKSKRDIGLFASAKGPISKFSIPSLARRPHATHSFIVVAMIVVVDVTIIAVHIVGVIGVVRVNRRRPPRTRICTHPKAALVCGIWASINYYRIKLHSRAPVGKSGTLPGSVKSEILATDLNSVLAQIQPFRQEVFYYVKYLVCDLALIPT